MATSGSTPYNRLQTTGQAAIDALNAEVGRKAAQGVAAAKAAGVPLTDPAFLAVQRPMSGGGIFAGSPIYVRRPMWLLVVITLIFTGGFTYGALSIGVLKTLACILTMFIWYDFYSGLLHIMLDEPRNIALPLLGQPALEFQWHHHIPSDIARKDFSDVVGDLSMIVFCFTCFHVPYSTQWLSEPVASTLAPLKLFLAYFGQASHRWAHDPKIRSNAAGRTLQQLGITISVKAHKKHHTPPFDEDFCLIGLCNPLIQAIHGAIGTRQYTVLALFLLVSAFDIKLLSLALKALWD